MNKNLKITIGLLLVILLTAGGIFLWQKTQRPEREKNNLIRLTSPKPNKKISSPLVVKGEARGNLFFEASFPVILVDWDGRIIAEHYASAGGDWMTENFVPFEATLEFESPYKAGDPDFMERGALILKKDNPSGLPEHDDALEIPIRFKKETK